MISMTVADLRELLLTQATATIVSLVAVTVPPMKAKDQYGVRNPFMRGRTLSDGFTVHKLNKVNGVIMGRYERIMENRLAKKIQDERLTLNQPPLAPTELEQEVQYRFRRGESWHRPIVLEDGPSCLSVNKKDLDDNGKAYLRFVAKAYGKPEYLDDTDAFTVDASRIHPYLSESKESLVDFKVYALESIVEIALNGHRVRVSDSVENVSENLRVRAFAISDEYLDSLRTMSAV